jgi:hypothetical protein
MKEENTEDEKDHENNVYQYPNLKWCVRHTLSANLIKTMFRKMQKWKKSLTAKQIKALVWYKSDLFHLPRTPTPLSNAFAELNYWLREGKISPRFGHLSRKEQTVWINAFKNWHRLLTSAMNKAPKLPVGIVVYRGVSSTEAKTFQNLDKNSTYRTTSYLSTTYHTRIAFNYADIRDVNPKYKGKAIKDIDPQVLKKDPFWIPLAGAQMAEIHISKGERAAFLDMILGEKDYSYNNEQEILFSPGLRMKYQGREKPCFYVKDKPIEFYKFNV